MAIRGIDVQPRDLFSYIQLEQRVPSQHPLRAIRKMVDVALSEMDSRFLPRLRFPRKIVFHGWRKINVTFGKANDENTEAGIHKRVQGTGGKAT